MSVPKITRDVFIPSRDGRGVGGLIPFYTGDNRIAIRYAWIANDDNIDSWSEIISLDHGATWGEPRPLSEYGAETVDRGKIKTGLFGCFYDSLRRGFLVMANREFFPGDGEGHFDFATSDRRTARIFEYDADSLERRSSVDAGFGLRGVFFSFCFPIRLSTGRLLAPAAVPHWDGGKLVYHPGCWAPKHRSFTVIGECGARGDIHWRAGRPVELDERSTRGFCESTVAELSDGRVAMILRGSNEAVWERQHGYKWAAFSNDGGENWTKPRPMEYDDGTLAESGASGGALFRSVKDGELYWIGNLCPEGAHARGNNPRSPLHLVQVDEKTFRFRKNARTVIDERGPHEDPALQFSNFSYYQERPSGDIMLFLTRYGERGQERWMDADCVRYCIVL